MNCKIRKAWINLELEHTNNRNEAKKIVIDHIKKHGCKYYPELLKLEKRLK